MPTIEQFTKEARAMANEVSTSKEALRNALNEACELLLDARVSRATFCAIEQKRDQYKTLLESDKCAHDEHKGVVKWVLRSLEYDIAKLEKVGTYSGF